MLQGVHRKFKGIFYHENTKEKKHEKGWGEGRKNPFLLTFSRHGRGNA